MPTVDAMKRSARDVFAAIRDAGPETRIAIIVQRSGLSERTVYRALATLKAAGLVLVIGSPGRRATIQAATAANLSDVENRQQADHATSHDLAEAHPPTVCGADRGRPCRVWRDR